LNLLPQPRFFKVKPGKLLLPRSIPLQLDGALSPELASAIRERLQSAAKEIGVELLPETVAQGSGTFRHASPAPASFRALRNDSLRTHAQSYTLTIDRRGVLIEFHEPGGLRAGVATLRQLFREYGRSLPYLKIRDWPDFPRRGAMLDISRGRVPKLETLLELVDHLADFKINEFQLYTEHTFAYRNYESVWRGWGAITAAEVRTLDARCRELGIDLVPNQNSFGHLRQWLEYPPLKKLAEVSEPYEAANGAFLRYPSTLAPAHPGTVPFLRKLYDELLPNFSSGHFNAGCDETWDLGRGQSRKLCEKFGLGRHHFASPGTGEGTAGRCDCAELGVRGESSVRQGSRHICGVENPVLHLPRHVHVDDNDRAA
jgi:N-acetyl-beta-hexosaminidase